MLRFVTYIKALFVSSVVRHRSNAPHAGRRPAVYLLEHVSDTAGGDWEVLPNLDLNIVAPIKNDLKLVCILR